MTPIERNWLFSTGEEEQDQCSAVYRGEQVIHKFTSSSPSIFSTSFSSNSDFTLLSSPFNCTTLQKTIVIDLQKFPLLSGQRVLVCVHVAGGLFFWWKPYFIIPYPNLILTSHLDLCLKLELVVDHACINVFFPFFFRASLWSIIPSDALHLF